MSECNAHSIYTGKYPTINRQKMNMYENADTNLLRKTKTIPKPIPLNEKVLESETRTKTFVLRKGGGVLEEGSSISQQIREPCKCQLPLIHGGWG